MNWGQIRSEIYLRLQDPNQLLWGDADLLRAANYIQDEITFDCEATTRHALLPLTDGTRAYTMPSEVYEIRGEKIGGLKLYGTQAYRLEEFDPQYLTRTGAPIRYYLDDLKTTAFHPIPTWTSSYTEFTSEFGEVTQWNDGTNNYTFSSEFGMVIDAIDDANSIQYLTDSYYGITIAVDSAYPVCQISYVYRPPALGNDTNEPDMPFYQQWAMVYGVLRDAFDAEGQGQNLILSEYYGARFDEMKKEWRARNEESAHGQNMYLSQRPVRWGSDLDWRERINP